MHPFSLHIHSLLFEEWDLTLTKPLHVPPQRIMVCKGLALCPWCPGKLVMADSVTLKTHSVVGNEQVGDSLAYRTNTSAFTLKGRSNR